MAKDSERRLQLLPSPQFGSPITLKPRVTDRVLHHDLDLKLSISVAPIHTPPCQAAALTARSAASEHAGGVDSLKWQAAEQIRLAAIEKAYAERVREVTRREMELAQSEFARARHIWLRAKEEVERAERLKERAMRKIDSTCMEITCQSCRQRFRP